MKKVIYLIVFACLVISACLLHLAKQGVSLRPESLISPSPINPEFDNLAPAVMARLLPEFEETQDVVFGFLPFTPDSQKFFDSFKAEYEKNLHKTVTVLNSSVEADAKKYSHCKQPCWILTAQEKGNQLEPNPLMTEIIKERGPKIITMTWISFALPVKVQMDCFSEKRLDFDCFQRLSIQASQRKIKADSRNFFLNSYNGKDYFLFIEDKK